MWLWLTKFLESRKNLKKRTSGHGDRGMERDFGGNGDQNGLVNWIEYRTYLRRYGRYMIINDYGDKWWANGHGKVSMESNRDNEEVIDMKL